MSLNVNPVYVRRLLAPIVLSLFAVGWYKFSFIYLTASNKLAIAHGDYAVYVVPEQLQGYLTATLWICYFLVFAGLTVFWYNLVKIVQGLNGETWTFGGIDVIMPVVLAVEFDTFFYLFRGITPMDLRIIGYSIVIVFLMWFWYALVKFVRVKENG